MNYYRKLVAQQMIFHLFLLWHWPVFRLSDSILAQKSRFSAMSLLSDLLPSTTNQSRSQASCPFLPAGGTWFHWLDSLLCLNPTAQKLHNRILGASLRAEEFSEIIGYSNGLYFLIICELPVVKLKTHLLEFLPLGTFWFKENSPSEWLPKRRALS